MLLRHISVIILSITACHSSLTTNDRGHKWDVNPPKYYLSTTELATNPGSQTTSNKISKWHTTQAKRYRSSPHLAIKSSPEPPKKEDILCNFIRLNNKQLEMRTHLIYTLLPKQETDEYNTDCWGIAAWACELSLDDTTKIFTAIYTSNVQIIEEYLRASPDFMAPIDRRRNLLGFSASEGIDPRIYSYLSYYIAAKESKPRFILSLSQFIQFDLASRKTYGRDGNSIVLSAEKSKKRVEKVMAILDEQNNIITDDGLKYMRTNPVPLNFRDPLMGITLLEYALSAGKFLLEALLGSSSKLDFLKEIKSQRINVIRKLAQRKPGVVISEPDDHILDSALFLAIQIENESLVELLLDHGASPHMKLDGISPVEYANMIGSLCIEERLKDFIDNPPPNNWFLPSHLRTFLFT